MVAVLLRHHQSQKPVAVKPRPVPAAGDEGDADVVGGPAVHLVHIRLLEEQAGEVVRAVGHGGEFPVGHVAVVQLGGHGLDVGGDIAQDKA